MIWVYTNVMANWDKSNKPNLAQERGIQGVVSQG